MPECGKLIVYEIGTGVLSRGQLFILPLEEVHGWMAANDHWACKTNQTHDIIDDMLFDKRGLGLKRQDWNWFIVEDVQKDGPLHTGFGRLEKYSQS